MDLLLLFAQAYGRMAVYDCHGVIDLLELMPAKHLNSGWAMCLMGKAFMELADYRAVERQRLDGRVSRLNGVWVAGGPRLPHGTTAGEPPGSRHGGE
jgi:hypothetical protein